MSFRSIAIILTSVIFALGLVMIFNTTSAEILDLDSNKNTHFAIYKQIFYAFLGCAVAFSLYYLGVEKWIAMSPKLLLIFSLFLAACFLPVIGREVNGSHRWITLGLFSFQPSEFVKLIIPAYFIFALRGLTFQEMTFLMFIKRLWPIAIPMLLILIEPNNGTVGVIMLTLFALCLMMRIPAKFWAIPLAVVIVVVGVTAINLPYVRARLKVYLNPELDLLGKGHQPYQAKIAAGSGGLMGRGPGMSLQKLSYLPEAQNDYIAAIFAEEYGFLGIVSLISLYMLLGYCCFSSACQTQSREVLFFAASIAFLISFQAFMNLGVVSGLLPSTGLNLPFFSQGGTSLIANLGALGLILRAA